MDAGKRKALKDAYKEKKAVGGVCVIECAGNHKKLLQASRDVEGLRHRFDFAKKINSCPDPSLRGEWERYGGDSFTFRVLETLEKGEAQSDADFRDDVNTLLKLWREKISEENEESEK